LCLKKKKKYHCTENQNLNLNTERHRQTSLWIGFLIIRLFGNLSDNFIYRDNFSWLSDSQSHFWLSRLGKNNDCCGKTYDYISDYTIPGYPLRRASQTVQKLFEVTLLLYCRREKTIKGGNFLWRMKPKKFFSGFAISHALWTIFCFLSHVHLRPFSFILNPKSELMDETAIDDYSSVRICRNANIPTCTFLFINRWC
jgi:hypothetical protein